MTLNELPDQGIEALVDLMMLIKSKCEWPNLCNRIVFIAKAAGGVRPIGPLFAMMRIQCKLWRIEAKMSEARITEGIFWATQARGVERCVWEQPAWSEWATADGHAVAAILYDLLKAFDRVAYQKLIDAAERTRLPMRQLKLLFPLCQAAGMWSLTALQVRRCRRNATPFRGVLSRRRSSSCCWWDRSGRCERRIRRCPFVSRSTTFRYSGLAATAKRRILSVQARAWRSSSCKQGAR